MANNNRTKGHKLERELAKFFRDIGFSMCKTTRASSRLLDDSKCDLNYIPLIVQAKSGYSKNYPKFDKISREINKEISKNFPIEHPVHRLPIVLVHKIDGRKKENYYWCFDDDFARELLANYYREYDGEILM